MHSHIFSDIDGTLIHPEQIANSYPVENEKNYFAAQNAQLIEKLQSRANRFTLVTGRRLSSFNRVAKIISHDTAILECGGLVLNANKYDEQWLAKLHLAIGNPGEYTGLLWKFEKRVQSLGYKTNHDGKFASFRIYVDQQGNLTDAQKIEIEQRVAPIAADLGVKTMRLMEFLDVIPLQSGKCNAIAHVLAQKRYERVFSMGDDYNDLSMLTLVGSPLCPANAVAQVKSAVRSRNGYIAPSPSHRGTTQMLEYILQ